MNPRRDTSAEVPHSNQATGSLNRDDYFRAAVAARRRRVVRHLRADGLEICDLRELAAACAEPHEDEQNVRNQLANLDLPQLSKLGIVKYDSVDRSVKRGPNFDDMVEFLEGVESTFEGLGANLDPDRYPDEWFDGGEAA